MENDIRMGSEGEAARRRGGSSHKPRAKWPAITLYDRQFPMYVNVFNLIIC